MVLPSLFQFQWMETSHSLSSRAEGFEFSRSDPVFLMHVDSPQTPGDSRQWNCCISVIIRDVSVCVWPWAPCQTPPLHHRRSFDLKHSELPNTITNPAVTSHTHTHQALTVGFCSLEMIQHNRFRLYHIIFILCPFYHINLFIGIFVLCLHNQSTKHLQCVSVGFFTCFLVQQVRIMRQIT